MSARTSRGAGIVLAIVLTGMGLTFLAAVLDESRNINNPMPAVIALMGASLFYAMLRGPVGRSISKMLEGESEPDPEIAMRVEDLETRLAELGLEQQRLAELEDRLDFAERLLSQRGEEAKLPREGGQA